MSRLQLLLLYVAIRNEHKHVPSLMSYGFQSNCELTHLDDEKKMLTLSFLHKMLSTGNMTWSKPRNCSLATFAFLQLCCEKFFQSPWKIRAAAAKNGVMHDSQPRPTKLFTPLLSREWSLPLIEIEIATQCVWLLSDGMQNGNDEFHSLHKGRTRFGQNMGVVWLVRSSNPLVSLGTWLGVMHLHHIPSLVQIVIKYVDHTLLKICDILWTILPLNTSCLCLQIWN